MKYISLFENNRNKEKQKKTKENKRKMVSIQHQKYFAPILKIHRNEQYKPLGINFLLNNSKLMKGPKEENIVVISPKEDDLKTYNTREHYLSYSSEVYFGENHDEKNVYHSEMYSHSYQIPEETSFRNYKATKERKLFIIQYFFMYGYNAPKKVYECCCSLGDHAYDLENMDILIEEIGNDTKEYQVLEVRFGCHRETDGMWKKWQDVEKSVFDGNERVVAYVALGSHGLYPDKGQNFCNENFGYARIFWAANDYLDSEGNLWFPDNVKSFDENDVFSWNDFVGGFEKYQDGDTPKQHTYYGNSPTFSTNWFLRIFCPCFPCW